MLSFLREQSNGDLPAKKSHADGETTPGDGVEKTQEQQYLTVATHEHDIACHFVYRGPGMSRLYD